MTKIERERLLNVYEFIISFVIWQVEAVVHILVLVVTPHEPHVSLQAEYEFHEDHTGQHDVAGVDTVQG